jgi:Spy/CpxP family protein refolding chaperone
MARQIRLVLAALVVVATATVSEARGPLQIEAGQQQKAEARDNRRDAGDRRPSPWWKNPKDMAEIGLTQEQSRTIDDIFHTELEKIKPLWEEIRKLERSLNEMLRANTADVAVVARQVEKIERMRAEHNTLRTVMLYRMRRVLSSEQNAKFQAMLDRREAEQRRRETDRRH